MSRLIALALLALTACGSEPDDAAILAEADRLAEPLPGLYRSTTTLETFDMPGAGLAQARIARDRMNLRPQVREFCLTPDDAAGGFRKMLAEMQEGDCSIERFEAIDGLLDARMRCSGDNAIVSTIGMRGEADPERSEIALDIEQTGDALPGGSVRMRMTVASVRTGDCTQPADPSEVEGTGKG